MRAQHEIRLTAVRARWSRDESGRGRGVARRMSRPLVAPNHAFFRRRSRLSGMRRKLRDSGAWRRQRFDPMSHFRMRFRPVRRQAMGLRFCLAARRLRRMRTDFANWTDGSRIWPRRRRSSGMISCRIARRPASGWRLRSGKRAPAAKFGFPLAGKCGKLSGAACARGRKASDE